MVFLLVLFCLASVPAYLLSKRRQEESLWLLFNFIPAAGVWVGLTRIGYGAQSLSNLIEIIIIGIASVVLPYMKIFLVDPKYGVPKKNTYILIAALVIASVLFRTFMPLLPE